MNPPRLPRLISLSMALLSSRECSEIVCFSEISCFKNQPCNGLYPKKSAGMHWLGYNDVVSLLNEAKTQIFQPTANLENFKIYLYFVCQPACQPAVRPGCTRCRAPEISHNKGNDGGLMKILF